MVRVKAVEQFRAIVVQRVPVRSVCGNTEKPDQLPKFRYPGNVDAGQDGYREIRLLHIVLFGMKSAAIGQRCPTQSGSVN